MFGEEGHTPFRPEILQQAPWGRACIQLIHGAYALDSLCTQAVAVNSLSDFVRWQEPS